MDLHVQELLVLKLIWGNYRSPGLVLRSPCTLQGWGRGGDLKTLRGLTEAEGGLGSEGALRGVRAAAHSQSLQDRCYILQCSAIPTLDCVTSQTIFCQVWTGWQLPASNNNTMFVFLTNYVFCYPSLWIELCAQCIIIDDGLKWPKYDTTTRMTEMKAFHRFNLILLYVSSGLSESYK